MAGPKGIDWSKWPLGLFTDWLIADNAGVTSTAVFFARRARGIRPCPVRRSPGEKFDFGAWPLGLVTDRIIADNTGVDVSTVALARKRRGIASFTAHRPRCDREAIRHLLGTKADAEIARETGLGVSQVQSARTHMGIKSTRNDWSEAPLGSVPDAVLAARYGVTHSVVATARWKRGVPAWREERDCLCLTPFVATRSDQRFCSRKCASVWWTAYATLKYSSEMSNLMLALWGYKRSIKDRKKGLSPHVEQLS
jgi:hypothetical protein